MTSQLAIIGAGASGLSCAIEAKRQSKKSGLDLNITVFEHLNKPCKKILATGNGRCNFCNTEINENNYYGDSDFINNVLKCEFNDTLGFFKSLGVLPYIENNRVYPRSEQAASIRDALLKTCEILNIRIITEAKIIDLKCKNNEFIINNTNFNAVIVATGGKSQEVQGSDGSGFTIFKKFDHKITEPSPALSALLVSPDKSFKELKGLRIKGNACLYSGRKLIKEEFGEIQFTENAISGIPILNLSHLVNNKKSTSLIIDTCYEITEKELKKHFIESRYKSPLLRTEEVLTGIIPQKLTYLIMKRSDVEMNTPAGKLTDKNIDNIILHLKQLEFKISGVRGFEFSQVTAGGLNSSDFNTKTLMSKKQNGLFACGEILNVNGDCGGYNLHFAWTSGRLAGASAVKYINDKG